MYVVTVTYRSCSSTMFISTKIKGTVMEYYLKIVTYRAVLLNRSKREK